MPQTQKYKLLGFLIFATFLMVILGISLTSVQMEAGELISLKRSEQSIFGGSQIVDDVDWFFVFIQGFLVILFLLSLIYMVVSMFDKEARRKLLGNLLRFGLLLFLLITLTRFQLPVPPPSEPFEPPLSFTEETELTDEIITAPSYETDVQPWMLAATIFGIALTLAIITFFGVRLYTSRKPAKRTEFQEIAENAQTALEEIEEAEIEFSNVIIRCYAEMSQALQAEGGIQRTETMTTQEFERELLLKGFPKQPVQQLTQLFEQVRYGAQTSKDSEKQMAAESLYQIVDFCRGKA